MPRKSQPKTSLSHSLQEHLLRKRLEAIGTWSDETTSWGPQDERAVTRSVFQINERSSASVHRHIDYPVDAWLVSCDALCISRRLLESVDLADAKREALDLLRDIALGLHLSLQEKSS